MDEDTEHASVADGAEAAPQTFDLDRFMDEDTGHASVAGGAEASVEAFLRGSGIEAHASALVALGFAGANALRDKGNLSKEKLLKIGMPSLEIRKFRCHVPAHDTAIPNDNARRVGEALKDNAGRTKELQVPATSRLPGSTGGAGLGTASTGTML